MLYRVSVKVLTIQHNNWSRTLLPIQECIFGIHRIQGKLRSTVWTVYTLLRPLSCNTYPEATSPPAEQSPAGFVPNPCIPLIVPITEDWCTALHLADLATNYPTHILRRINHVTGPQIGSLTYCISTHTYVNSQRNKFSPVSSIIQMGRGLQTFIFFESLMDVQVRVFRFSVCFFLPSSAQSQAT
jgi:hypothetical protein